MGPSENPVLIVGAGPTGLVLAVELARRNVPIHVIDRLPEPLPWDRATVMKPRSVEVFDTLGLADRFLERGHKANGMLLFFGKEQVAAIGFDSLDSQFPHFLLISEEQTERILTERLAELGGRVERGLEFTGLEPTDIGIRASLRTLEGKARTLDASWVVGTDGFHSAVRAAVDDAFEGHDNPSLWGVIDAHIANWRHPDDRAVLQFGPFNLNPLPLPDGRWRIYFRPDSEEEDVGHRVNMALDEISPGAAMRDPDEAQFFHTHTRIADRYRIGRVLLAGDAAHTCSPIGGHGMNVGIQDAHNLGWKLALVACGEAPETLLDSYEPERRPMAEAVGQMGDDQESMGTRQDPAEIEEMLDVLADPRGRREAISEQMELAFGYADSPIVGETVAAAAQAPPSNAEVAATPIGFRVGEAAGLECQGRAWRLAELIGDHGFCLFLMLGEADPKTVRANLDTVRAAASDYEDLLTLFVVTRNAVALPEPDTALMRDPTGALHARLGAQQPGLCLVRPDGHLGFRAEPPSLDAFRAHLVRVFGPH